MRCAGRSRKTTAQAWSARSPPSPGKDCPMLAFRSVGQPSGFARRPVTKWRSQISGGGFLPRFNGTDGRSARKGVDPRPCYYAGRAGGGCSKCLSRQTWRQRRASGPSPPPSLLHNASANAARPPKDSSRRKSKWRDSENKGTKLGRTRLPATRSMSVPSAAWCAREDPQGGGGRKGEYEFFDDNGSELPPCEPPSPLHATLLKRRDEEGWGSFGTDASYERGSLDHLEPAISQLFSD